MDTAAAPLLGKPPKSCTNFFPSNETNKIKFGEYSKQTYFTGISPRVKES